MTPIVVEGRFVSPTQIELAHPVNVEEAAVEIEIRARRQVRREATLQLLQKMASRPARGRSREDIEQQIAEERSGWDHRR